MTPRSARRWALAAVIVLAPTAAWLLMGVLARSPIGGITIGAGPWQIVGPSSGYVIRPEDQPWPDEDILQRIAADAAVRFPEIPAVGVFLLSDARFFNRQTFSYYTAHLSLQDRLHIGMIATRPENTLAQVVGALAAATQVQYILAKTGDQGPTFTTALSEATMQALDAGTLPYVKWAGCGLPDGSRAIVYRRR